MQLSIIIIISYYLNTIRLDLSPRLKGLANKKVISPIINSKKKNASLESLLRPS